MDRKFSVIVLLGAIFLSFLLYGNNLKGDFVYDDEFFTDRPELRNSSHLTKIWLEPYIPQNREAGAYRPLAVFSFALNYIFFGESTFSFHLVNILLNGLVVFLVFLLVFRLFGDKNLALISSILFAFLPIHTEAVNFIKAREELLSSFFGLLSWLTFISATNSSSPNYQKLLLSSFLFLLAVLSKELIFVLPLLFLAVFWIRKKPPLDSLIKAAAVFIPASLIYLVMRYLALGSYAFGKEEAYFVINPTAFTDFWTRIWTAFKIAFIYIGKTFVPINLTANYHYNHLTLVASPFGSLGTVLGILLLLLLVYLMVNRKFRDSPLSIGAVAFLIPYLVFSKFFFTAGEIVGERWIYFPSIGLSIIAGYFIYMLIRRNKVIGYSLFAGLLILYASFIIPRNKVWANEENLYKNMVKTAPQSVQSHFSLAIWYMENNKIDEAIEEADAAFKIYPDHPPLLNLIGTIAFLKGSYSLSEDAFLKAIELRPKLAVSYSNLAKLYYRVGEYQGAEQMLETLINNLSQPKKDDLILYKEVLDKLNEK